MVLVWIIGIDFEWLVREQHIVGCQGGKLDGMKYSYILYTIKKSLF